MRKLIILLILCVFLLGLTSCYDSHEMDDLIYVITIGVDKGVSDKWRLSVQFPTMNEEGVQEESEEEMDADGDGGAGYSYATIDAPSFFTGIDMLNATLPRDLNFSHCQVIVFSQELAEEGLIGKYIAPITRFRQIRRSGHLFVVEGQALEFVKENKPLIGTALAKNFQIFAHGSEDTGFFPHITLQEFYQGLKSPYGQAITAMIAVNEFENFSQEGEPWGDEFKTGGGYLVGQLPRVGQNKVELWGTALFNGDVMVGQLTGGESRFLLMVRGEFTESLYTIQDPNKPDAIIPMEIREGEDTDINIDIKGENPVIQLNIHLNGDLLAVQSMIDYEQEELKPILEENFKKYVEEGITELISKCQDLNIDVFDFGEELAKKFLTIDALKDYDWNSRFEDAEVEVEVDFVIRRTGTQIKSSPIRDVNGGE